MQSITRVLSALIPVFLGSLGWIQVSSAASAGSRSWYSEVGLKRGIHLPGETPRLDIPTSRPHVAPDFDSASACQVAALRTLGWKVESASGSSGVEYSSGNPCDNASIAESQAQGELIVRVPSRISEGSLSSALAEVLKSPASVCAYQFRLGDAAVRATERLYENKGFYFFTGGFPLISLSTPDHWTASCSTASGYGCFYPRNALTDSLDDFVSGSIGTECAVGLQAAEYSTLRELYGDASFNRSFAANEIVIAPWSILTDTASATWGDLSTADTVVDTDATQTSQKGAQAFIGFSGYIGNVYGEDYLDNEMDRGENFMTVSVSQAAGAELAQRGGFAYFNRQNERLFQLGQLLNSDVEALALDVDQDPNSLSLSFEERNAFTEMQSILSNPVYTGYQVYVHPLGLMTFGEHIVRLLGQNPRTPYQFMLYPSRMPAGLYERYVKSLLDACGN